jgi:hypothetical protein
MKRHWCYRGAAAHILSRASKRQVESAGYQSAGLAATLVDPDPQAIRRRSVTFRMK